MIAQLEFADRYYRIKAEAISSDLAWPFKCAPIKVARPHDKAEFLKAGTITLQMLHLIDPDILMARLNAVAQDNEQLTRFSMSKDRYMQLYRHYHPSLNEDRVRELQERVDRNETYYTEGLEFIEHFSWKYGSMKARFKASLELLQPAMRPQIQRHDHLLHIVLPLRPFHR